MKAFRLDCNTELERLDIKLGQDPRYENATFNKDMMDSATVHRGASRNDWLNPSGFNQAS